MLRFQVALTVLSSCPAPSTKKLLKFLFHNIHSSHFVVVIDITDIPCSLSICPDKFIVSRRTFWLCVACKHALDTHADALHVLNRTPSLFSE